MSEKLPDYIVKQISPLYTGGLTKKEVAKTLGIGIQSVNKYLAIQGTKCRQGMGRKYDYNYDVFFNEDDISFYLLGAFMTDGSIVKNGKNGNAYSAGICSIDKDWMELMREHICTDLPVSWSKDAGTWNLRITDTKISNWFIDHKCVPNKTLSLEFPVVPQQYMPDFIRGCMDGDGSLGCYPKTNSVRSYLCSSSKSFILGFNKALDDMGIIYSFFECTKKNSSIGGREIIAKSPQYRTAMAMKASYKLLQILYYEGHKISLPRKKTVAQTIITYCNGKAWGPNTNAKQIEIELP